MSSEDITFCGYDNCPDKLCERHICHIRDYRIPHSFAYFDNCPLHTQLVDDLRSIVSDFENQGGEK